jgi:type II secretory pathway pseudopilin PulG
VELLVVIAIVAILAALVLPSARGFLDSSRIAKSTANLKTLAQGVNLYVSENNGDLPLVNPTRGQGIDPWWEEVYKSVYQQTPPPEFFQPRDTATNLRGTAFHCPFVDKSGEGTPVRSYGYNSYLQVSRDQPLKFPRLKQPSKTVMLGTSKNTSGLAPDRVSARAGGKILVVFADGHADKLDSTNIPDSEDIFWKGHK